MPADEKRTKKVWSVMEEMRSYFRQEMIGLEWREASLLKTKIQFALGRKILSCYHFE